MEQTPYQPFGQQDQQNNGNMFYNNNNNNNNMNNNNNFNNDNFNNNNNNNMNANNGQNANNMNNLNLNNINMNDPQIQNLQQQFQQNMGEQGQQQQGNQFKEIIAKNLAQNVMNNIFQEKEDKQFEEDKKQLEEGPSCLQKCFGCFTIEFYQPYFDVNTDLVKLRLETSFNPLSTNFFNLQNNYRPDMYGPFWVYTTLVFTLAAAGNLSQYLQLPKNAQDNFNYNFNFVPQAATLSYGLGYVFPIILTFLMKMFGTKDIGYIQVVCIYGYAMACFIPTSVACAIPVSGLQILALAYGSLNSTFFMIYNITSYLEKYKEKNQQIVKILIFGFQLLFFLTFKFYFFNQIYYTHQITDKDGNGQTFNNNHDMSQQHHQYNKSLSHGQF